LPQAVPLCDSARVTGSRSVPSRPIALAAVALALLWLLMLTLGTGGADDDILRALYAGGHPALVGVARGFAFMGDWQVGIPVVVAGLLLLLWLGRRRGAVTAFLVIAVGRLLVEAQKHAIARLRPEDQAHLVAVSSPSFPSGHAANSMIVCLTFALVLFGRTRWRWPAVTIALLLSLCIGFSRILLGVHWPSDVIGGWAFGLLWVLLAMPLAERLAR
jgi:undecaprenyl-diphosphatase